MECERVREEFVERLTGTLDPARARAVDDHIASCTACRAETVRMRELWTELGTLSVPPATGAAGRVERMIDARASSAHSGTASRPLPAPPRSQIALAGVGLAATLLIGLSLGQRLATTSRDAAAPSSPPLVTAAAPKEKYVLLLHGPARTSPTTPQQSAADSAAERALVAEYSAWAGRLAAAGSLVMAEKLADDPLTVLAANGATQLPRFTADELGGFFVIQAADSAEAFRIARECPHLKHGGTVQVRRIEPT